MGSPLLCLRKEIASSPPRKSATGELRAKSWLELNKAVYFFQDDDIINLTSTDKQNPEDENLNRSEYLFKENHMAAAQFLVAKTVFDLVAANPGKKQEDIVALAQPVVTELNRSAATARTMLYALKRAGAIVRTKEKGVRAGAFVIAEHLQGKELTAADMARYVTRAPLSKLGITTEEIIPVHAVLAAAKTLAAVTALPAPVKVEAPTAEYDVTKFSPPKGEGELVRGKNGRFLPRFVRTA